MTNGQIILNTFSNAKILCISKYDGRVTVGFGEYTAVFDGNWWNEEKR